MSVNLYSARGRHGEVVRIIGLRIMRGELAPGHVLDVDELERELGVSRTVVREAVRVLGAKGLVDARPKRGTFVRSRSDWSLLDPDLLRWQFEERSDVFLEDLQEMRGIVEPAAARLAALRRSDEDIDEMEAALEDMARASDEASVIDADLRFHRALLNATNNELLVRTEVVIETGLRARDTMLFGSKQWRDPVSVHRLVLEAVRHQAPDVAEAAMQSLLQQAQRDLELARRSAGKPDGLVGVPE